MIDYSRNIPRVSFEDKELESFMYDFMMENLINPVMVNGYIGLVMIRLGFKTDDKIELRCFNRDKRDNYFQCIVNDKDYYDISFSNVGNKKKHTKITLVEFNKSVTYECFPLSLSELGVRIIPVKESIKYADGVEYSREYSRENAKYSVSYLDYQLELDVVKSKEIELPMYDKSGNYSRYRIENEDVLFAYLTDFFYIMKNKDIVTAYNDICEMSLGNNLGEYGEVSLKFLYNGEITDLIYIKNGELEKFGISLPNVRRRLFLNKDGSWTCGVIDDNDLYSYSMDVNGDKINYNISLNGEIDNDIISEIIKSDTEETKKDVEHVKKLVRTLFDNGRRDGN